MNILILEQAAKEAVSIICNGSAPANENVWLGIATQFVQEKGWQWCENPQSPYNIGNVTNGGVQAGFATYPSLYAGVYGYAHTILHTSFDGGKTLVYQNVIEAVNHGSAESVITALHESPFCDPPYPLPELQSILNQLEGMTKPLDVQSTAKQTEIQKVEAQIQELQNQLNQLKSELVQLEQQSEVEYVVVTSTPPHNTLWGIAADKLGNGNLFPDLMRLNPGINPGALQVGQKVRYK